MNAIGEEAIEADFARILDKAASSNFRLIRNAARLNLIRLAVAHPSFWKQVSDHLQLQSHDLYRSVLTLFASMCPDKDINRWAESLVTEHEKARRAFGNMVPNFMLSKRRKST